MKNCKERIKDSGIQIGFLCTVLTEKTGQKITPSYMSRVISEDTNTLAAQTLRGLVVEYCDKLDKTTSAFLKAK